METKNTLCNLCKSTDLAIGLQKKVCFIIFGSFKCSLTGEAEPPMLESGTWQIFITEALKVKRQVVH